mgnify:CR=1 FL=1
MTFFNIDMAAPVTPPEELTAPVLKPDGTPVSDCEPNKYLSGSQDLPPPTGQSAILDGMAPGGSAAAAQSSGTDGVVVCDVCQRMYSCGCG